MNIVTLKPRKVDNLTSFVNEKIEDMINKKIILKRINGSYKYSSMIFLDKLCLKGYILDELIKQHGNGLQKRYS